MSSRGFIARGTKIIPSFALLLFVAASLQGCLQQPIKHFNGGSRITDVNNAQVDISLNWGVQKVLTSGGYTNANGFSSGGDWSFFCFENNNPCVRAETAVRNVIGNAPVAIQAFALNLNAPSGTTVKIVSASVTTAEIQFDVDSGRLILDQPIKRNLIGSGCNVSAPNSVGFNPAPEGRILTGIYFLDEGSPDTTGASYLNAYLTSGRVWYSGLVPAAGDDGKPFHFTFTPNNPPDFEPAVADFGRDSFEETDNTSAGKYYVPLKITGSSKELLRFGADDSTPKAYNHVVVGFCINGTKTTGGKTRPAFLGAQVRTYQPQLEFPNE